MNIRHAIDPTSDAHEALGDARSAIHDATASTGAKLKKALSNSKTSLDHALDHAIDAASDGYEKAERITIRKVKEQPFVAAGVALGAGVLLGMLIAGGRRS